LKFSLLKYAEELVPVEAKNRILQMIRNNATSLEEVCQVNLANKLTLLKNPTEPKSVFLSADR
jgi:16S rRNA G966 N2-methylase RsmD